MTGELPNRWRRASWSANRAAMYSASCPRTHLANNCFFNRRKRSSLPHKKRASMRAVLDCMSLLASVTHSSMVRVEWPTLRPKSLRMPSPINASAGWEEPCLKGRSCRNRRSMSLHGLSSPRPYPPSATKAMGFHSDGLLRFWSAVKRFLTTKSSMAARPRQTSRPLAPLRWRIFMRWD